MISIALSMSFALRSGILVSAISRTWAFVTVPTFSLCGTGDPFSIFAACRRRTAAGGVLVINVNERSSYIEISTGTIVPACAALGGA